MTAISTQPVSLSATTAQQFLSLSEERQKELLSTSDYGQPLWLVQVKTAIKRGNRLSYAFLTPDRNAIDSMDSIFNKFSNKH